MKWPFQLRKSELPLAGMFALFAVLQLVLLVRLNINWDEYFFLSQVHSYLAGTLTEPVQTFPVQLLWPIALLPLDDPDRILAGRLAMFACEMVSLYCVYRIARLFSDPVSALFAPVAWIAAGYALAHGMSFRADPLAGSLMMASLALLFCSSLSWRAALAAGILAALGLMVTMKSVFFLPAFAGALAWRWGAAQARGQVSAGFAVALASLLVTAAILWFVHVGLLAPAAASSAPEVAGKTAAAAVQGEQIVEKVVLTNEWFPRGHYIARWAMLGFLSVGLALGGVLLAFKEALSGSRAKGAALLLLALPLVSLAFYRNAFPYFLPFIFLPAAILAAFAVTRIQSRLSRNAMLAGMAITMLMQFSQDWPRDQSAQRQVAREAQRIFPDPVGYIDRNGLLPSYPKVGFLMSTWGVEGVVARGKPVLAPLISRRRPLLVIANTPVLEAALDPAAEWDGPMLHGEDVAALRDNYIPHWGPLWVAGKALDAAEGEFALVIAGTYTLECAGVRSIDGSEVPCGSAIPLAEGRHEWSGGTARLRWGDHLLVPEGEPPADPIYYGF